MLSEAQIQSLVKKSLSFNDPANKICSTLCLTDNINKKITVKIQSEKDQIISGLSLIQSICHFFFKDCKIDTDLADGSFVKAEQIIFNLAGPLSSIIDCKDTLIYYLSRMSAITDIAYKYKEFARQANPNVKLVEGDFWNPDMMILEKYACNVGGLQNYKRFFQKSIIINENHLLSGLSITDLTNRLEESLAATTKIQVHPRTLEQVKEAANLGVDLIKLKDFSKAQLKMAVHIIQKRTMIEVSGDLSPEEVQEICVLPIDYISSNLIIKNSGFSNFSLCL